MWTSEQIKIILDIAGRKPAVVLNFILIMGLYFLWQDNQQQRVQIREQGMEMLKIKDELLAKVEKLGDKLLQQKDDMLEVKDQSMEAQKRLYENYMDIKRIRKNR